MINKLLEPFFQRLFNPDDEERKVLLLQFNIFLIISILLMLKPLSTGIMLNDYGVAIMPLAYGLIAIAAISLQFFLLYLRRRLSLIKLITYNSILHIAVFITFTILLKLSLLSYGISVLFYVYVNLFSLVTVTFFYQYCQSLLTIREAKKVLAQIGSGAIAGGVFGGYFASSIVALSGNIGLILVSVLFLILSSWTMYLVHKDNYEVDNEVNIPSKSIKNPVVRLIKNHHVKNISLIIGFGVIVSKLVDYQFNAVAKEFYSTDEALTSFFAFWFSSINVIGLILQIYFVKAIIDRLGNTNSMAIMPTLLLVATIGIIVFPILSVAIFLKLIDGSLKQSLYKTSTEINIMPLPINIRDRAKTLIDVAVDSIATGIAGGLIFLLINYIELPIWAVASASLGCIAIWLFFIFKSKKSYLHQLKSIVVGEKKALEEDNIDQEPENILKNFIQDHENKNHNDQEYLLQLTQNDDPRIRSRAVKLMVAEYGISIKSKLSHVLRDPSILVRKNYFGALLKLIDHPDQVTSFFNQISDENKIVLVGALANVIGPNLRQQRKFQLPERVDWCFKMVEKHSRLPKIYNRTLFTAIAQSKYKKYFFLIEKALIQNEDLEIKRYALFSMRKGRLKSLFPSLINCNPSEENLEGWQKTIAKYPFLLMENVRILQEGDWRKLLKILPSFLYIDNQEHLDFLFSMLEHKKMKIRKKALIVILKMKLRYEYLDYKELKTQSQFRKAILQCQLINRDLAFLEDIVFTNDEILFATIREAEIKLKKQLRKSLKELFLLLSIIIDEDLLKILKAIRKGRVDESLDFLDQILPFRLRRKVIPLIESIVGKEKKDDLRIHEKLDKKKVIKHLRSLDEKQYEPLINMI